MRRSTIGTRVSLLVAALFVAACNDAVSPERGRSDAPLFSFSANGIQVDTINGAPTVNGSLNETGRLLAKGFDHGNPTFGDAIIATFYWVGSTNIVDSVIDFIADANNTRAGNPFHLVEYVTAGNRSMATYVATNVRNFPERSSTSGQIYAVRAYLTDSVADGGVKISAWVGVEDNFALALGEHRSASGSDTTISVAHAGPITVGAGGVAYTVTMSGLWGLEGPQADGYAAFDPGSDNFGLKENAAYRVFPGGGTTDPRWTWYFDQRGGTWLVTTLALNAAGGGGPTTGNLNVTASTSGSNLDPDGYTVTVDGGSAQAIGVNGNVSYSNVTAGSHTVAISGVAANCSVSGGTSQTVNVPAGGTATAPFTVSCTATTGNLTVSTSTSGSSVDPDGYTVTVDGGSAQAIGTNTSVSYTNLTAGSHSVQLSGVGGNCTVSGANPRTISVPSGGTATTTFTVTCSTPPGNVTVSATTSGSGLDPDGYTVTVAGQSKALAINGSVTISGITPGGYTVVLSDVAANCTVSGGTSRAVNVTSGGTATASYSVSCTAPNSPPVVNAGPDDRALTGLLYSISPSFSDANGNGPWSYTIEWGDGSTSTGTRTGQGSFSVGHTYVIILPRHFTIRVTVRDAAGASGSDTKDVFVVLL